MATNYTTWGGPRATLNTNDLNVGDTLVQASWAATTWTERVWTVAKILKSRLVLTRAVTVHDRETTRTLRVLVDNSKYGVQGQVSARIEGQSEWDSDFYYFFTPDEPVLAALRDEKKAAGELTFATRKARVRADDFTKSPSVARAEEAVAALLTYIELQKKADNS